MRSWNFRLGMAAAGLALAAAPVLAGQKPSESGSPHESHAAAVGSAEPCASGGGGSSTTTSVAVSASSWRPQFGLDAHLRPQRRRPRSAALPGARPTPRNRNIAQRVAGGGGSKAQRRRRSSAAAARTAAASTRCRAAAAHRAGRQRQRRSAKRRNGDHTERSAGQRERKRAEREPDRAVPSWSRPRGDRPSTGVAVPRTGSPSQRRCGDRRRGLLQSIFPLRFRISRLQPRARLRLRGSVVRPVHV